jgi:chromosome segregation ATPase
MFNPTVLVIAALAALASISGAYIKGRVDGKELGVAECSRTVAKINSQIREANERNRAAKRLQEQAFDAVIEARRETTEQLARAEEEAEAELQKRIGEYEAELDTERNDARLKLSEYEAEIAALADSCLLTGRDIDRMRRGKPAVN